MDDFTIQCPECGTHYNDLQEVCPYCGAPQPAAAPETPQQIFIEPPEPNYTPAAPAPQLSDVPPRQEDHLFADDDIFAVVGEGQTEAPLAGSFSPDAPPPPDEYFVDDFYPDEAYPPEEAFYADEADPWAQPGYEPDAPWDPTMVPPRAADEGWADEAYFDAPPDEEPASEGFVMPFGTPADTPLPMPQPADGFFPPEADEEPGAGETLDEEAVGPRRIPWRRFTLGCMGIFACVILLYGGIGLMAVRSGLQERALLANSESLTHYRRGQELMAEDSIDLAIAEFERAVKLNPTFREARQALRDAQQISLTKPTPTSETRTAAAADIFAQAETLLADENWNDAIVTLSQVRDLDSAFQSEQVADMLFTAHYNRGLQLLRPDQIAEALAEFEAALAERPTAEEVAAERSKATLYLTGIDPDADPEDAIRALVQLQRLDEGYLDVAQLLPRTYQAYGDSLGRAGEWCQAQVQFAAALELQPSNTLRDKLETSTNRCQDSGVGQLVQRTGTPRPVRTPAARGSATPSTPTAGRVAATGTPQAGATSQPDTAPDSTAAVEDAPAAPATGTGGRLVFSNYNPDYERWEVLAVPASGGQPTLLAPNGIMPALSPNGQTLLYRSERQDSIGIHALNLATGQDVRATKLRQDVLPRWGGENNPFIFVAQSPGMDRWEIFLGFADGKSDPINQGVGRTPTWSPDGKYIAFQGTDPAGNNPGIYVMPFGGGEAVRLTSHESDRSPAFSPDGSQVAYMSTQGGNWDVYVVSSSGGQPRRITTTPGNDGLPIWSPDGTQLAYVSDSGGRWGIFITGLSGGNPTRVTDWDGARRADWLQSQIWWGP